MRNNVQAYGGGGADLSRSTISSGEPTQIDYTLPEIFELYRPKGVLKDPLREVGVLEQFEGKLRETFSELLKGVEDKDLATNVFPNFIDRTIFGLRFSVRALSYMSRLHQGEEGVDGNTDSDYEIIELACQNVSSDISDIAIKTNSMDPNKSEVLDLISGISEMVSLRQRSVTALKYLSGRSYRSTEDQVIDSIGIEDSGLSVDERASLRSNVDNEAENLIYLSADLTLKLLRYQDDRRTKLVHRALFEEQLITENSIWRYIEASFEREGVELTTERRGQIKKGVSQLLDCSDRFTTLLTEVFQQDQ